ncbi:hypothetical protein JRQ81_004366 [Phrynocephalus forsythii]|uniref:Ig-like domain-containing protein n=1 Tax=Phrynocephalus forsythii TaxID=171643 RepID=A0A9Q0XF11_9SAUR|nr:hypothetical protein JRQ81_004366 [Phrynocephalus forsythii]
MITLVIVVLSALALDGTHGESVFQSERLVTVRAGQPVFLPCHYESAFSDAANTLFWYKQGSPGGLQHLLSSYDILNAETRKERKGFSAEKKAKSYNLTKDAAELSDSAVYFCALSDTVERTARKAVQKPMQRQSQNSRPAQHALECDAVLLSYQVCTRRIQLANELRHSPEGFFLCRAKTVTQDAVVVGSDGKGLNLSCHHPSSSTADTFLWYRQFPKEGPQLVSSGYKGREKSAELDGVYLIISEDRKSSVLSFTGVSLQDAAVYYCALVDTLFHPGASWSDSVFQALSHVDIQDGENVTLPCNFTTLSSTPYLFWYRQHRDKAPQWILTAYKTTSKNKPFAEGKFSTILDLEKKTVPLTITGISLQEEAIYYCALSPTMRLSRSCVRTKSGSEMLRVKACLGRNP